MYRGVQVIVFSCDGEQVEKTLKSACKLSGRRYACTSTEESMQQAEGKRVAPCQNKSRSRTTILKDGKTDRKATCKATCKYVQVIYAVQP